MKKILIISVFSVLLFAMCKKEKHQEKEHIKYQVTTPVKKDTIITKDYVCQIHSIQHIELRALEKGYLKQVFVDEGQYVKKGQLMFKIMPNIYEADLQKAVAEAKVSEIELKNTKILAEGNVVSQNELAMAKAKLDKANAEVQLAKTHLNFTNVKAPFSGIMNHLDVREGSLLDEGELLTTLSNNSKMWVYFNVPETEYLDYITSQTSKNKKKEVRLLMANNKLFNQVGVVETIEGEFNNETGNIAFRATFSNPDKILRHGETGSILMSIPYKNALIIPQKATFEVLDKRYVFVINKENIVEQREINVEAELPHLFIVSKGLTENDRILLEGIRLVKHGEKVETEFIDTSKVVSGLALYSE